MKTLWDSLFEEARYDPRAYFILFLLSNIALAYSPLGFRTKIWIGVCGIMMPWAAALLFPRGTGSRKTKNPLPPGETSLFPGPLVWSGLCGLALFLRLFQLTALPVWPMWDD